MFTQLYVAVFASNVVRTSFHAMNTRTPSSTDFLNFMNSLPFMSPHLFKRFIAPRVLKILAY